MILKIRYVLLFVLLVSLRAVGAEGLISPFFSTVPGVDIYNTHELDRGSGFALRGMRIREERDWHQLSGVGVNEVLIFRNSTKGEEKTSDEEIMLKKLGVPAASIETIPFPWDQKIPFAETCDMTVRGLNLLRKKVLSAEGGGIFFHCTVGEDRTGYLAGLYRVLYKGEDVETVWKKEMCEHGYADGNPGKPGWVVKFVHTYTSQAFYKMVHLIKTGVITADKAIDPKICSRVAEPMVEAKNYSCSPSPYFQPELSAKNRN